MVNVGALVGGILLALIFFYVMVFKVLPTADHVVKREYGAIEACICTRFCCLCIMLPLYAFFIWMLVLVTFDADKGMAVIEEICPSDFDCVSAFSFGKFGQDKEACESIDCSNVELLQRSGSLPSGFKDFGLGNDLEPERETVQYTVVSESLIETDNNQQCECVAFDETLGVCNKIFGCDDDIETESAIASSVTCTVANGDGLCSAFTYETDSVKQFSFKECQCDSFSNNICETFTCEELVMGYFYPNVAFALAIDLLFILPLGIVWYSTLKTQLKKLSLFRCGEMNMYVYNQEAGMQSELHADNLATGGFTNAQAQKEKYRSFRLRDGLVIALLPFPIAFLVWVVVEAAGRVAVILVSLTGTLVALVEIARLVKLKQTQSANLNKRLEINA